ncbi:DUF5691 domain-containing protein [Streptomyces sp. 549]|uniref:DUF5691 domain-containing protein n=1 Tax=Streptomyces sp. 549 TaxID=3049076 RepID=UPI0024C3245B|nr:DUF5691 domain-containing protein [Streptomyces sp. 549]MDK1472789.1 DUF5691 domain-containing protein [Streptomyces sp. 549]
MTGYAAVGDPADNPTGDRPGREAARSEAAAPDADGQAGARSQPEAGGQAEQPGGQPVAGESAATGWEELVTAALLGAERRPPPGGSTTALLDLAAVATVRRRAGLLPARAAALPAPAPDDPRPALPAAAGRRLSLLLAGRTEGAGSGGRRGSTPDLGELLPQWLAAANGHGYRPPPALLPTLLDAARARTDLRAAVLEFAGPRARWLAALNPEWRFALRSSAGRVPALPHEAEAQGRLWTEGLFAERVALLAAVRRRDPDAGRRLLESTWSTERAEDRLMFLDSLREQLGAADEPFLEQALGDRSRTVRATAAELLSALPQSALAARMSQRARSCVSADRTGLTARPGLVVEAPHECDAGMQRDGVVPKPPAGRGERSWWLSQVVEAAPLGDWSAHLGGRSPAEIVALRVADDWQADLHAAWARAAVRQRDVAWARALTGKPSASAADTPGDSARLLAVLPEADRADWAAEFVAAHGLSEAFRVLGTCSVPWSEQLGRAVVDALEIARDAGSYPWSFSGVLGLAERSLDPRHADRLIPLAAHPDESEAGAPGAGGYWAESFQRLVATLHTRAAMLDELADT